MPARPDPRPETRFAATALFLALAACGCVRMRTTQEVQVGAHQLRLVPPRGWEHLDHGRTQIYRHGDSRISLLDFGPTLDSLSAMIETARERTEDTERREIARQSTLAIRGASWVEVETWDRVTHAERRALACLDDGGNLLVLSLDRGDMERDGRVYTDLLDSIEILPPPGVRGASGP